MAKLVMVEPTMSTLDIDNYNYPLLFYSEFITSIRRGGSFTTSGGIISPLTNTHIKSRQDVKGKLPMGTTQPVMTKCTPTRRHK